MNENRKYNKFAFFLCMIFSLGAIVFGSISIVRMISDRTTQAELEELAEKNDREVAETVHYKIVEVVEPEEMIPEPEPTPLDKLKEKGIPIPDKEVDFEDLQTNVNADIFAWIYIPDSVVDYPILQHPTDNSFYLEHNIDGSKGRPGCIYIEDYNTKEFTDPNTVIYGHNMRAGTMFADLHKFEDKEYFDSNPYVYIYTPEELLVYEVFAAYEHNNEHILYYHDFTDTVTYQIYLDEIFDMRSMRCNIRDTSEVTVEDRIITLSTCVTSDPDKRYLVQGVLLNED